METTDGTLAERDETMVEEEECEMDLPECGIYSANKMQIQKEREESRFCQKRKNHHRKRGKGEGPGSSLLKAQ